jgi:hypothetical protein
MLAEEIPDGIRLSPLRQCIMDASLFWPNASQNMTSRIQLLAAGAELLSRERHGRYIFAENPGKSRTLKSNMFMADSGVALRPGKWLSLTTN